MKIERFLSIIGSDFYVGVPDSQLKALCDYLMNTYGIDPQHHIIAPNEGNCAALAAGYYLATGKIPVVYLQNSGIGNLFNPCASLLHDEVYGIACQFIIGWRGEPNVHDEPQHIKQGAITLSSLELLDIKPFVVDANTTEQELANQMKEFSLLWEKGQSTALVIKKGAFTYDSQSPDYQNTYILKREEAIRHILSFSKTDIIVSTTGKTSRELFELRETNGQNHSHDFLTVGSMGHSSSIALGIALQKQQQRVWCLDGDGALMMHMGAMAMIGSLAPKNFVHVVINNGAHESVGGMPTTGNHIMFSKLAANMGYVSTACVQTAEELNSVLSHISHQDGPHFVEVFCKIGSRHNLGRPTTTPSENKEMLMKRLENMTL